MSLLRRAALVVPLLLAAGCASTGTPGGLGAGSTSPTAPSSPVASATRAADTGATPATGTTTSAPTGPPAASASAEPPRQTRRKDWAPLEVSLSDTCLVRGDEFVVSATSLPRAGLGFAVGYSQPPKGAEKFVPDFAYFDHEANPTGTIHWSFVVRPTTPLGPGVVKVVANAEDGRGAFVSLDIEVAAAC